MHFPNGALKNSPRLGDIEIVLVTAAPWTMNILPLASVDEEKCIARTAIPGTYALTQPRFGHFPESAWVENTFAALDRPGEWVLDSGTRTVYLIPEGEKPGDDIAAPALTELIRIEGAIDYAGPKDTPVRGLVFRGLTFTQADRYTGEKGRAGWGIQHDWEMFDRPSAMVRLDLHCRDNRIADNVIERVGGVGILLCGYGPGTKDVNRRNRVTRNHIHHVVEVMTDGNGIYIPGTGGGNLVGENFVHDCPSRNFAEGIRCDDDQHETIIERNIIWRLGGLATCVTLKGMNHVRNNIFAADPLFVDPAKGNFDPKPGSPALKLGFKPIDMSRIGLR